NNYGGGGALAIAPRTPPHREFQNAMKFDLSPARTALDAQFCAGQWGLQSVFLQLTSSPPNHPNFNDNAPGLFGVSLMQNSSWVEGTGTASMPTANGITFNSLQNTFINNAVDQGLGTFHFNGGSSGANSYSLNLSSDLPTDIASGNVLSLRLF